jgi:hypothetical protein
LQWSKTGSAQAAHPSKAERRAEAKAKGYEGEMCGECGNFTRCGTGPHEVRYVRKHDGVFVTLHLIG